MSDDAKAVLLRYLQRSREAILWKLDGLSDFDARRPLTPTGTNILGLVKHLAGVEAGYFGDCFGRPVPDMPQWYLEMTEDTLEDNGDLWARADESRESIVELYRRVAQHTDAFVEESELDTIGTVPWWGESGRVTLHGLLIHVIAETNRHGGHADIVRELIDGSVGLREGVSNLPTDDPDYWRSYSQRVQEAADRFR